MSETLPHTVSYVVSKSRTSKRYRISSVVERRHTTRFTTTQLYGELDVGFGLAGYVY
jgi:hypothetical protein